MKTPRITNLIALIAAVLCIPSIASSFALAGVEKQDFIQLGGEQQKPIYEWRDPGLSPKAVVVTIHGVSLHGGVYDALGRHLAAEGFIVLSPDLIGHGRRYYDKKCQDFEPIADYVKAEPDLLQTLKEIRSSYPGLKVFWLGESLGANYAVRLAAQHPDLVDGIILSAPTIKRHHATPVKLATDVCVNTVMQPNKQLSIRDYAAHYLSEDPRIINGYLADPLMRKSLSPHEMFTCEKVIRSTLPYAGEIGNKLPVLVIQGTEDKMVQAPKAEYLMSRMKTNDRTLHWAEHRGHILFMTEYVQPDLEVVLDNWLSARLPKQEIYKTASDTSNTSPHGAVAN